MEQDWALKFAQQFAIRGLVVYKLVAYKYTKFVYLHVMEVYLKVTIAMFYFYHLKNSSNIMKNVLSPSRKKNLFVLKYKKQIC